MKISVVLLLALGCATDPNYKRALEAHGEKAAESRGQLQEKINAVTLAVSTSQDGLVQLDERLSAAIQGLEEADAKVAQDALDGTAASVAVVEKRADTRQQVVRQGLMEVSARSRQFGLDLEQFRGRTEGRHTVILNEIQSLKDANQNIQTLAKADAVERPATDEAQDARLDALENAPPPKMPEIKVGISKEEAETIAREQWEAGMWAWIKGGGLLAVLGALGYGGRRFYQHKKSKKETE
jgi:hypothetical protein